MEMTLDEIIAEARNSGGKGWRELAEKRETYLETVHKMRKKIMSENRGKTDEETKSMEQLINKANRCAEVANELLEEQDSERRLVISDDFVDLYRSLSDDNKKGRSNTGRCISGNGKEEKNKIVYRNNEALYDNLIIPHFDDEERQELSIGRYVRGLVTGNWENAELERRAMTEGSLANGGYMVPTPLSTKIIDIARNKAQVIRAGALTVPMDSQTLAIARIASGPTAAWKAENAAITSSDMSFEKVMLTAKTLVAMCKLSVELAEDAQNIDSVISDALAQALALELDRAALFGTGSANDPLGVWGAANVQTYSMGTNGLALTNYDPFSRAVQQIKTVNGVPNGMLWNPRTEGDTDRLKDTSNQPLQAPDSFKALSKFSTNQIPINQTQGTATNASSAFIADWSQLMIGMRTNITIEASRQAADSTGSAFGNLQVWIRVYLRADVQLALPNQFCIIKGILPSA